MQNLAQRVTALRGKLGWNQQQLAKRLGCSRNYVSMIEGGREPSKSIILLIEQLESELDAPASDAHRVHEAEEASPPPLQAGTRRIAPNVNPTPLPVRWLPVISWVHAGEAASYEELPLDSQELVPVPHFTGRAFLLRVEGDSMEDRCLHGDCVVLTPDREARSGNLVVAKLKRDGVVLRRFTLTGGGRIRLTAYNPLYPPTEHGPEEFHWIYPVKMTLRME